MAKPPRHRVSDDVLRTVLELLRCGATDAEAAELSALPALTGQHEVFRREPLPTTTVNSIARRWGLGDRQRGQKGRGLRERILAQPAERPATEIAAELGCSSAYVRATRIRGAKAQKERK